MNRWFTDGYPNSWMSGKDDVWKERWADGWMVGQLDD